MSTMTASVRCRLATEPGNRGHSWGTPPRGVLLGTAWWEAMTADIAHGGVELAPGAAAAPEVARAGVGVAAAATVRATTSVLRPLPKRRWWLRRRGRRRLPPPGWSSPELPRRPMLRPLPPQRNRSSRATRPPRPPPGRPRGRRRHSPRRRRSTKDTACIRERWRPTWRWTHKGDRSRPPRLRRSVSQVSGAEPQVGRRSCSSSLQRTLAVATGACKAGAASSGGEAASGGRGSRHRHIEYRPLRCFPRRRRWR